MDIGFIFKIAAIGLITAIINQVLQKSSKEEYTTVITLAGIMMAVLMLLPRLRELSEEITSFFS